MPINLDKFLQQNKNTIWWQNPRLKQKFLIMSNIIKSDVWFLHLRYSAIIRLQLSYIFTSYNNI